MKVAIVGANSYIARNLNLVLKEKYPEISIELYDYQPFQLDGETNYVAVQILEEQSIKKIDLNVDIIFMFIGKTGSVGGFEDFNAFIDINEKALLCLLNEYRNQNSSAKIIYPSTRLVYKGKNRLQKENDEKEFKTIYSINKFACEQYLEQFSRAFGIRYCVFRICIPYGSLIPGLSSYGTVDFMLGKAIAAQNIILYGDGSMRRTVTYIGDLCNAMILGSLCENCIDDVYNIGGEDYSLKEMAELLAAKYDVKVEYIPWPRLSELVESGDTVFDDSKLQSICPVEYKKKYKDWVQEIKQ